MDKDIDKIESDRRKREAALLLLLLLIGAQSRRFVLHAVRLGSDPQDALRRVWMGGEHFKGVVRPLAAAMADSHNAGHFFTGKLVGNLVQNSAQGQGDVDWQLYEPAARRAATMALDTMSARLATALQAETSPVGQLQAVRQAWMDGGWTVQKPATLATLASSQIVSSYGAGMFAAAHDNQDVTGFVHRSILDNHTTEICEDRDGLRLPKDDAYWLGNFPPLHFGCRSVLMPVMGNGPWSDWRPTVPPMAGFGASPISFTRRAA